MVLVWEHVNLCAVFLLLGTDKYLLRLLLNLVLDHYWFEVDPWSVRQQLTLVGLDVCRELEQTLTVLAVTLAIQTGGAFNNTSWLNLRASLVHQKEVEQFLISNDFLSFSLYLVKHRQQILFSGAPLHQMEGKHLASEGYGVFKSLLNNTELFFVQPLHQQCKVLRFKLNFRTKSV